MQEIVGDCRKYCNSVSVPIIFSITGHTDVPDAYYETITSEINELFDSFKKLYPHTEFILMSGFAEGADRLAVKAALSRNIHVGPVLPCPPEQFEKSFRGQGYDSSIEESVNDFRDLLSREEVYTPCVLHDHDIGSDAYRDVGAYLIANSHILIAVWDGNTYSIGTGGTYDNVRMAYEGIDNDLQKIALPMSPVSEFRKESSINYLNLAEDCLIYWVQSERLLDADTLASRGMTYSVKYNNEHGFIPPKLLERESKRFQSIRPSKLKQFISDTGEDRNLRIIDSGMPNYGFSENLELKIGSYSVRPSAYPTLPLFYDDMFRNMDELNREGGAIDRNGNDHPEIDKGSYSDIAYTDQQKKWNSRFNLVEADDDDNPTEDSKIITQEHLMDDQARRYNMANQLSLRYRDCSKRSIWYIIAVSSLAAFLFQLFLMANTAAIIVAMYGVVFLSEKLLNIRHLNSAEHRKYIEYRSIAECTRVNYYWGILGVNDSAYTSYYGFMKNETYWVRSVLKSWSSYFLNDYDVTAVDLKKRKAAVIESWINSQERYHSKKAKDNSRLFAKIDNQSMYTVITLLALSIILALGTFTGFEPFNEVIWTVSMSTLEGIDINRENMEITTLTIIKLAMISLTIYSGYLASKKGTINGGTPEQIGAKEKMFVLTALRSEKIRHDYERVQEEFGNSSEPADIDLIKKAKTMENADFISLLQELGLQCIDENNDWVFDLKTKDISTLNRQEDMKDIAE